MKEKKSEALQNKVSFLDPLASPVPDTEPRAWLSINRGHLKKILRLWLSYEPLRLTQQCPLLSERPHCLSY